MDVHLKIIVFLAVEASQAGWSFPSKENKEYDTVDGPSLDSHPVQLQLPKVSIGINCQVIRDLLEAIVAICLNDLVRWKQLIVGVESSGGRVQLPQLILLGIDQGIIVGSELQVLPQHCLLTFTQKLIEFLVLHQVLMHLLVYRSLDHLVLGFYFLAEEGTVQTLYWVSPFDGLLNLLPLFR